MALVAAGVAVIALTGLMALTRPDEQTDAAPNTTEPVIETPTTVSPFDPYQVGEPLTLQLAGTFHSYFPIATVYHVDDLLVFSPLLVSSQGESSGLTVRSAKGDNAALATSLSSEFRVSAVEAGSGQLVAAGVHIGSGQPWAWTSTDGVQWDGAELPIEGDSGDWNLWNNGIAVGPDVIAVAARGFSGDGQTAIEDSLSTYLGVDTLRWGWGWGSKFARIEVYGPLGIVAAEFEAEQVGLTADEITRARGGYSFEDFAWVSTDGAQSWQQTATGSLEVQSVFVDNHSNPVLVAYGPTGMNLASFNGDEWVPGPRLPEIWEIHRWTGGLVAVFANRPAVSTDGSEWDRLAVDRLLPEADWWEFSAVAGGEYGIATVARGQADGWRAVEVHTDPFSLSQGEFVLTLDDSTETLELRKGSDVISTTHIWSQAPAKHIVLDLADETATFLEPETGESLVTFSFEEIEEAERSRYLEVSAQFPSGPEYVLFSDDAETWRIGTTPVFEEPGSFVTEMDISEKEIALTFVNAIYPYESDRTLLIEIWTADLD